MPMPSPQGGLAADADAKPAKGKGQGQGQRSKTNGDGILTPVFSPTSGGRLRPTGRQLPLPASCFPASRFAASPPVQLRH